MANKLDNLDLRKIMYRTTTNFEFDVKSKQHIATVSNPDLSIVLTNTDKTKLVAEVKKVVEMHCYFESMEYIDRCLFYSGVKSSKVQKTTCNVLVSA